MASTRLTQQLGWHYTTSFGTARRAVTLGTSIPGDEHGARDNQAQRDQVGQRERSDQPLVDPDELNPKSDCSCEYQVPAEHDGVGDTRAPPANEHPCEACQGDRLVQLSRVHSDLRRRKTLGKRHTPRQIRWSAIVVANKK